MKNRIIFILLISILFGIGINVVYAKDVAGGNGNQGGAGGSTGGGTSCSYPVDAGKNVDTDTYLFDLVQRKKGSTSFKHLGCVIIGKEANKAKYDTSVHKNCEKITALGKNANAENLKNIAEYLSQGNDLSDLNKKIENNPEYARTYAAAFSDKYKGTGFDASFDPSKNTNFGGNYGYRILIQKFIYVGCTGNWEKYVVPRKEAYRKSTGVINKVNGLTIIGTSHQADLYTTQKDIGIKKGKKVSNASKSNFTDKNDGTGYNILWFNTDGIVKQTCEVTKNGKKTEYYDLCLDSKGKPTKDGNKCKTVRKIAKSGKDKNGNQLYEVKSLSKELTLQQVKDYINIAGCEDGPKCTYQGNTCYDDAGIKMSTCDVGTKTWIDNFCEKQCWYDPASDAYYEDVSSQGTKINQSTKRNVLDYSCSGSWNGDCTSPYSSTSFGSETTTIPSPGKACGATDSKFSTNDCTYAKLISNTKKCYYTTTSCETVDDYETQTDDKGNSTQVKVGSHEECSTDYHWGPSYNYSTTCNYTGTHKEYYIDSAKKWMDTSSANQWLTTCKVTTKKCAFDTEGDANDDAWYDNNSNYHTDGLTSKIALWINNKCNVKKPSASVTCSDCDTNTSKDGTAFKYTETSVTDGLSVLGSYFGGDTNDETDLIQNHYLKQENGNNQVYCSEDLTIKLPNGQTTNLNKAKSGRYVTINLLSPIENIVNMTPITITSTQTCSAIENNEITVGQAGNYMTLSSIQTESSRAALQSYVEEKYNSMQSAKRADGLGGIKLVYDDKEYKIDLKDDESDLEQFLINNTKSYTNGGNTAVLTQEAKYTLKPDIYQYVSIKNGSSVKNKPNDLSNYYNLGNSTLPIRFSNSTANHITFVYDYEGTNLEKVFEDPTSFPLSDASKKCVSNIISDGKGSYTCEINTKNKCDVKKYDNGKVEYFGKNGDKVSKTEYDKQCPETNNVCKIQKTDKGNEYYYNGAKVDEAEYRKNCSCLEKDGHYYLNGEEIEEEDYKQVCPTQCTTVCPAGEICCPVGGSDMPCSVDGICPTSGGNKIIYRTIDLENPFTGQSTKKTGRNTGTNWCSYNIKTGLLNCDNLNDGVDGNKTSTTNSVVYKHIKTNAGAKEDDVYRQTPQYSITLNSTAIDKIRKYNDDQKSQGGYDDFTLSCYNATGNEIKGNLYEKGIYTTNVCRSSFLRDNNIFKDALSGKCANGGFDNLLICSERSEK